MRIWAELDLEVASERADAIAALLVGLGATGVEHGWRTGEAPPLRQPWDRESPPMEPTVVLLRTGGAPEDRSRIEREIERLSLTRRWHDVDEASWSEGQQHFHRMVIGP